MAIIDSSLWTGIKSTVSRTKPVPATNNYAVTTVIPYTGAQTVTGNYGQFGGVGSLGIGNGGYGQAGVNVAPQSMQQHYIGPPSGAKVSIAFAGADGFVHSLVVDHAYFAMLNSISQQHNSIGQMTNGCATAMPHSKMLEGDFSIDEMEKAELIIAELAGGEEISPKTQETASQQSQTDPSRAHQVA